MRAVWCCRLSKIYIVRQCVHFNSTKFTIETNSVSPAACEERGTDPTRLLVARGLPSLSSHFFLHQTVLNPLESDILHLNPDSFPLITDVNWGGESSGPWLFKSLELSKFSRSEAPSCFLLFPYWELHHLLYFQGLTEWFCCNFLMTEQSMLCKLHFGKKTRYAQEHREKWLLSIIMNLG